MALANRRAHVHLHLLLRLLHAEAEGEVNRTPINRCILRAVGPCHNEAIATVSSQVLVPPALTRPDQAACSSCCTTVCACRVDSALQWL